MTISNGSVDALSDETSGWDNLAPTAGTWRNIAWDAALSDMRWGVQVGKFTFKFERIVMKFRNITPTIPPNAKIVSAVLRGAAFATSDTQSFFTIVQVLGADGLWDPASSGPQWVSASVPTPDGIQTDADVTLVDTGGTTIVDTAIPVDAVWAIRDNVAGRGTKAGQSVQSPSAFTLGAADIRISRAGAVAVGDVWCEIYSLDVNGLADVLLATSDTIVASAVPAVSTRVRFTFSGGEQIAITALQNVAVVLNGDYPASASQNIRIGWKGNTAYTLGTFQIFGTGVGFDDQNYPMVRSFRHAPPAPTSGFVVWTAPQFFVGVDYDTPNLAALLQIWLLSGNYAQGDSLAFTIFRSAAFFPSGTAQRQFAQFGHATLEPIRLIVEWKERAVRVTA